MGHRASALCAALLFISMSVHAGSADFGDLPNTFAPAIVNASNGDGSPPQRIGPERDLEAAAAASLGADGDDLAGVDDEDATPGAYVLSNSALIHHFRLNADGNKEPATLCGFLDANGDADFSDPGEITTTDVSFTTNPSVRFSFSMPLSSNTYLRWRILPGVLTCNPSHAEGFFARGEIEDHRITLGDLDFGDLPDSGTGTGPGNYQTLLNDEGPSHVISGDLRIGALADGEPDGQPTAAAAGDDNNGDDESAGPFSVVQGATTHTFAIPLINNTSAATSLCGFLDLNGDGDFDDFGERAQSTVPNSGTQTASLTFSGAAMSVVNSFARLRLIAPGESCRQFGPSANFSIGPDGPSTLGEVEDLPVTRVAADFGDLPDSAAGTGPDNYQTLLSDGGPFHSTAGPTLRLGSIATDSEANGVPNAAASGDDAAGSDDEDGNTLIVAFPDTTVRVSRPYQNDTSLNAALCGFLDLNADGDFDDADERRSATVPPGSGTAELEFAARPSTNTYLRLRLIPPGENCASGGAATSGTSIGPDGQSGGGEVEDYRVLFGTLDLGDLPDPGPGTGVGNYQTRRLDNGPSHFLNPSLSIKGDIDTEADGVPNALAIGDDLSNLDDESSGPFLVAQGASTHRFNLRLANFTSSPTSLCGFIDFNGDGDFDDVGERASVSVPSGGEQIRALTFTGSMSVSDSYLRLRLIDPSESCAETGPTLGSSIGPDGHSLAGEVEDYTVTRVTADFGDLPDSAAGTGPGNYQTLASDGGPFHAASSGPFLKLGNGDSESDGAPSAAADGDDLAGSDDEEAGLVLAGSSSTHISRSYTNAGANTQLCGFLDLNGDGDFDDANERQSTVVPSGSGTAVLTFASPSADSYARLRLIASSESCAATGPTVDTSIGPDGPSSGGEVEDYRVLLADLGDLPDSAAGTGPGNYQTTLADNGPLHSLSANLHIAGPADPETNGQPTAGADGDDSTGDDEAAGPFRVALGATSHEFSVSVFNNLGSPSNLCGFLDLNGDGDFDEVGERASVAVPSAVTPQSRTLSFTGGAISVSSSFIRLRLIAPGESCAASGGTTGTSIGPDGISALGEVEDHPVMISRDWGDLPDTGLGTGAGNYQTLLSDGGASHRRNLALRIGDALDDEADGQPSAGADGDDLAGDDESAGPFLVPQAATTQRFNIPVFNNTGSATEFCGFLDLNGDGDFDEAGERANVAVPSAPTTQVRTLTFAGSMSVANSFIRLRLLTPGESCASSGATVGTSIGPDGASGGGEVEDHPVQRVSVADFGDLPDSGPGTGPGNYRTLASDGGAFHLPGGPNWLGFALTDTETDGVPSVLAMGDEGTGTNDEDLALVVSHAGFTFVDRRYRISGPRTHICGFLDLNVDGDFDDPGERASVQTVTSPGVTANASFLFSGTPPSDTYLRLRMIRSDETCATGSDPTVGSSIGPDGPSLEGEVEDYRVLINVDFGDLPDSSLFTGPNDYQTEIDSGGASHKISPSLRIGAIVDAESDGQPHPSANADASDESVSYRILAGSSTHVLPVQVTNSSGLQTLLCGFLDLNGDGDFDDAGERAQGTVPSALAPTPVNLTFTGASMTVASSFTRLRLIAPSETCASSGPGGGTVIGPNGHATGGEVEDHSVTRESNDYGDLPDTGPGSGPGNYQTTRADNGPFHVVTSALALGSPSADTELDGAPGVGANGDDSNGSDDENALFDLLEPLEPISLIIDVFNTLPGVGLCGFIDLNADGDFADSGETAWAAVPNGGSSGIALSGFGPPDGNRNTFARFRTSSDYDALGDCLADAGNGPPGGVGGLDDGEVEDYPARLVASADVAVTNTANPPSGTTLQPGASVRYTWVLTNNGPRRVNGASFASTLLSANVGFASWVVSAQSGAPTISTPLSGSGNFAMTADMPAGATITVTADVVLNNSGTSGPLSNTLTYTRPDGVINDVVANNSAATSHPIGTPNGDGALCATPGAQGALVQAGIPGGGVVNTYFPGTSDVAAGSRCIPLGTASGFALSGPLAGGLSAGDLLLVIQMQGAEYNSSNTDSYGDGVPGPPASGALNNANRIAGRYEYVTVRSAADLPTCAGGQIGVNGGGPGRGLIHAYDNEDFTAGITSQRRYQIVRVPQYSSVALGSGQLNALDWQGRVGGVLAVDVRDTLDLGTGSGVKFNATGAGFRGGRSEQTFIFIPPGYGRSDFRNLARFSAMHASKGEGYAGRPRFLPGADTSEEGYLDGSYARGAPGNAGGGATDCVTSLSGGPLPGYNSGGGGGGNGGAGGRGGDCLIVVPSDPPFDRGGFGGALVNDTDRLFAGGGGGAGSIDGSLDNSANGGDGGGIIVISANQVIGSGTIATNGANGGSPSNANDGAGGGGAGGTLRMCTNSAGGSNFNSIAAMIKGGDGGSSRTATAPHGPGGGGAGGRFFQCGPQLPAATLSAQNAGGFRGETTPSNSAHGAENGAPGAFVPHAAYADTPGTKPGFICASGSVPVTLASVEARRIGNELSVEFGVASETGTLGYRVYVDQPGVAARSLQQELVLAQGSTTKPQRYSVRGTVREASSVWIEEVAIDGRTKAFGPFPISERTGEPELSREIDWAAINAEQASFRASERRAVLAARGNGAEYDVRVTRDGWQEIRGADLLALDGSLAGASMAGFKLSLGGTEVALELDGSVLSADSRLRFYGRAVSNSIYTDTRVYRLSRSGGSARLRSTYARAGTLPTVSQANFEHAIEGNKVYNLSSPLDDPWALARITRSGGNAQPFSQSFSVSGLQAGPQRLSVHGYGGLDFAGVTDDHSLEVVINGVSIANRRFGGVTEFSITMDLPANTLRNGENNVSVRLLADTGQNSDVVFLERIAFRYPRTLMLDDESLQFDAPSTANPVPELADRVWRDGMEAAAAPACRMTETGCTAYAISVPNGSQPNVLRLRGERATRLAGEVSGGQLRFADLSQAGDRYVIGAARVAQTEVHVGSANVLDGNNISYLMISHPSFQAGLGELVAARQAEGFAVKVVNVEDLYRTYTQGVVSPMAIEAYLREARSRWGGLKFVLLVGGDSYDYKRYLPNVASVSFVPTRYVRTSEFVAYGPADSLYGDLDGDGLSELAVGRFPVRTADELSRMIAKTLAYGRTPARTAVWANDKDQSGYPFGTITTRFANLLSGWTAERVDLNIDAPAAARAALVAAINGGQALTAYFGHSSPSNWSQTSLLTSALLQGGLLSNPNPTAVLQFGCYGNYFVDPTGNSMAHAFLLSPNGAATMLGATAITETVNVELLARTLLPLLQNERSGEALRKAARALRSTNSGVEDVTIGMSVLGDPSLELRR